MRKMGSFPCGITQGQEVGGRREQGLHVPGMDMVSVQGPVRWPQRPTHQEVILRLLHLNTLVSTRKGPVDKLKMQEIIDVKTSVGDCMNGKGILFNATSKMTSSIHPQHPHECQVVWPGSLVHDRGDTGRQSMILSPGFVITNWL